MNSLKISSITFVEDIGKHVEASAVGHPENDFVHPVFRRMKKQGIQHGNQGIGPLQGEPGLAHVFFVQEAFEKRRLIELVEDALVFRPVEKSCWLRIGSMRSWSQRRSEGSWRCMYSTPTDRQ